MKKILILASNPDKDLDLDYEIHALKNIIEESENLQEFDVIIDDAISPSNIQSLLLEHEPRIVHFCGHGSGEDGLVFIDAAEAKQQVSTQALSNLFQEFDDTVECVLLNACYSEVQAKAIANHINYAIGMNQAINDDAAIFFAKGFYQALGSGKKIRQCFRLGKNAIELELSKLSGQPRKFQVLDDEEYSPIPEHLKPTIKIKSELTLFPEDSARQEYIRQNQNNFDFGQRQQTNLSKKEYRFRQILLNKVRDSWIKGVLENSLHTKALLELEITGRPDLVHNPFSEYQELPVDPNSSYEWLHATDVFEQMGDGRTLLILGEPGSGKTIALLKLAKRFIEQAENNLSLPIPVVFNLSSWATKRKPIAEWLIIELKEKYQVSKSLAKQWIEQEQLLLLLDGLDEVKQEHRNNCVKAINEFLNSHGLTEIVVCSRFQEYESLLEKLQLRSAIYIQSLTSEHIDWYLKDTGDRLSGLKTLLKNDAKIEEFAKTPLILSIMSLTYEGSSSKEVLEQLRSPNSRREKLFDNYIEKMFSRIKSKKSFPYSKENFMKWLCFTSEMNLRSSNSIILIENLQPSLFLSNKVSHQNQSKINLDDYKILRENKSISSKLYSSSFSIINKYGLLLKGLLTIIRLFLIIVIGIIMYITYKTYLTPQEKTIFLFFLGLISIMTFVVSLCINSKREIILIDKMQWSTSLFLKSLIIAVKRFFIFLMIGGFLISSPFSSGSATGLELFNTLLVPIIVLVSPIFLVSMGFAENTDSTIIKSTNIPNEKLWKTLKFIVKFSLYYALFCESIFLILNIAFNQTSILSIFDSPITFLVDTTCLMFLGAFFSPSLFACIQHFALRISLYIHNITPWNYRSFLDYSSTYLFMQKVGGGYIFIHRMLQEHFAKMEHE